MDIVSIGKDYEFDKITTISNLENLKRIVLKNETSYNVSYLSIKNCPKLALYANYNIDTKNVLMENCNDLIKIYEIDTHNKKYFCLGSGINNLKSITLKNYVEIDIEDNNYSKVSDVTLVSIPRCKIKLYKFSNLISLFIESCNIDKDIFLLTDKLEEITLLNVNCKNITFTAVDYLKTLRLENVYFNELLFDKRFEMELTEIETLILCAKSGKFINLPLPRITTNRLDIKLSKQSFYPTSLYMFLRNNPTTIKTEGDDPYNIHISDLKFH